MEEILYQKFLGNTVASYLWFVGIILAGLIFKKVLSTLLSRLLFQGVKKYSQGVHLNKFILLLTQPISVFILLLTFYLAFDRLEFPTDWNLVPLEKFGARMLIFRCFQVAIILSVTWVLLRLVDFFSLVLHQNASLNQDRANDQLIIFFKESVKIVMAIFSFFFIMGFVFQLNITSLIAGLGIGGLAIALAAKESLENLLGSFTIFLDKPFMLGDQVQVGKVTGTVEKIGFRSTRIRTAEKSVVTVPNKKMVDAELENLSQRVQRRAEVRIDLSYETSVEQLRALTKDLKAIFNGQPLIKTEGVNVHFMELKSYSLELVITYNIDTNNADIYIETKEAINFKVMETIVKNKVVIAHPSQMIYLNKEE